MLTIFSTPKPFRGHIGVIQRNAITSWTLLHPDVEVILFGDDEGAAEAARDLGARHEPCVERNKFGSKRLDYMFQKAQAIARHDTVCYVNCDIVLLEDFSRAVEKVQAKCSKFLVVGRRWDTPITEPIDFSETGWQEKVRAFAFSANDQRDEWWIDYFAFSRGFYGSELPPFVVGTVRWDNWLMWKALSLRLPVIDASQAVVAVHQNHDYSHHPQGKKGVWEGAEAQRNLELAGGWDYIRNISHSTKRLGRKGQIRGTWARKSTRAMRDFLKNPFANSWYALLNITHGLRHTTGLNREGIEHLRAKLGGR